MTYDNWKCTDPNDRFLGPMGEVEAWERYEDGELTLDAMGEVLLANGHPPHAVRLIMTARIGYSIPRGYFGKE